MILRKYFYFAMLVLASVWLMPSCSEDDVISAEDEEVEVEKPSDENGEVADVPNPAGDDFYMFVNGEWHESLTDTDVTQGYITDVAKLTMQRLNEVAGAMDEVAAINKSLAHLYNGGQQDNLDRVEEIIEELLADVETKNDAYRAIGQMIAMGMIDDFAKLYMVFEEGEVYYTIAPGIIPEEKGEEAKLGRRTIKNIDWKKYKKYTPKSRTADEVLIGLVEGLGLGLDYLSYAEELDEFIVNLDNCSLEELVEFILDNVQLALLPYCGDEYVQEITEGQLQTTADYFNETFVADFNYSLSYYFNQAYVSAEVKEMFKAYGEELKGIFAKRIENAAWLSAQGKQAALLKLENMKLFYGWPDNEYTEEAFAQPEGELLVDDMIEVKMSRTRLIGAKLGNDVRNESMMLLMYAPGEQISLTEYNAVNLPYINTVNILPAYMIEPEFSLEMDPSEIYVSLSTLGHEMAHSFDTEGINYGPEGDEADWLMGEDKAKFEAMAAQFAAQISTLEAIPGIYQDGNLTKDENLADLVGLNITFDALNECLKKNGVSGDDLKEAQKNFFEFYTFRYCANYSAEDIQKHLADVHGFDQIRVNGIVQHMEGWYELYNVVEGDVLYLPKEERITIW